MSSADDWPAISAGFVWMSSGAVCSTPALVSFVSGAIPFGGSVSSGHYWASVFSSQSSCEMSREVTSGVVDGVIVTSGVLCVDVTASES